MPTHLDTLQDKERWGAWNQGAFLKVTTPEKREVHLSRWDVHTLLVSATEAAFASAPSGSAARTEKAFLCSGGAASQPTELVIQQPTDANGWIAELRTLPGTSERFYRLGPWIVRVAPPDYYAYVHAATTADEAARYRRSTSHGESYRAMFDGSRSYDRTDLAKRFLKGIQVTHVIPPSMAQLAVALLVSEAARNWRTWGINLMLLDLLDSGATTWDQLLQGDQHPMARGSSFDQAAAKTGMKGGRATTETWSLEASITMRWLSTLDDLTITPAHATPAAASRREQSWRDPVKGEAYSAAMKRRLQDKLIHRFQRLVFRWEPG